MQDVMNIAAYHVATIRDGQFDPHAGNDQLCRVRHDRKCYYYDLSEADVTEDEFRSFVCSAWNVIDPDEKTEVEVIEWVPGVFRVSLD